MGDGGTIIALLAAGRANRFGGGKLDEELGGKPVGLWAAESAETAGFARRVVITPPMPPSFIARLKDWQLVINADPETGMASSIRTAARAAAGSERLVIVLADMPFIEPTHLTRLARGTGVAFTLYEDGSRGAPAAFPAQVYPGLASLADGQSPAALDWSARVELVEPRSRDSLTDIDTTGDLALARGMSVSAAVVRQTCGPG